MTITDRQTLIEQLFPLYRREYEKLYTIEELRAKLQNLSTRSLQIIYDEQVAAGRITPPQVVTAQEIEIEAARQQAREIRRQAALQERQQIILRGTLFSFGAVIPDKTLVDCVSNRQQLASFVNPGEQINNPVLWLKKVLADNPSLIQKLAWADPPPSSKQKAEAERQQREYAAKTLPGDREKFRTFCFSQDLDRPGVISDAEANFNVLRTFIGPGLEQLNVCTITTIGGHLYLLTSDGELHDLIPATSEDITRFKQEREEARVEHLKQLSRTNNISELRRIARKEPGTPQPETNNLRQLEFEFSLLTAYSERESTMPELPEVWQGRPITFETIHSESKEFLHELLRTFGRCQVDRVLHNLPPDFFANASQKLVALEQQLGLRRAADFVTRPEVLEALQTRNQI
jgi:hypothetical protein